MAVHSSLASTASRKHTKHGTASKNKHRFQSFTQRIANLDIDPIRRRRRRDVDEAESESSKSYFTSSFNYWRDLNLSEHFKQFSAKVDPWCQSLPQVVHHDKQIFGLLLQYINNKDSLSLEPLLDLLSQFAHDLGQRFETYFPEAIRSVASLAAQHPDVEVIEWSFTCLSWLFKYLSRLLVPNLEPLYRSMAPLLGKEPQKPHTTRFAAEAMSFLIRKAASTYERDSRPLQIVVGAVLNDLSDNAISNRDVKSLEQYKYGIMTLMINSIKGVDRKLHSHGHYVYRCLLEAVKDGKADGSKDLRDVLYGTTIAAVHHTDSAGLSPIVTLVVAHARGCNSHHSTETIEILAHLLFLLSAVRQGSRIINWQDISDAGLVLLGRMPATESGSMSETHRMICVIMQAAPVSVALNDFRAAMKIIDQNCNEKLFLSFCTYFNDLGRERFQKFLLPYFSAFVTTKWKQNRLQLLCYIPKLVGDVPEERPRCSADWQEHILQLFHSQTEVERNAVECFQTLELLQHLVMPESFLKSLTDLLEMRINQCLQEKSGTSVRGFILGSSLRSYLSQSSTIDRPIRAWWPLLCQQAPSCATLPLFLESILHISQYQDPTIFGEDTAKLTNALIDNLHTNCPVLRKLSLEIIERHATYVEVTSLDLLRLLTAIETSPLTLSSARFISLQARKVASSYHDVSDPMVKRVIAHFCFGMLTYKLAQARDDAIAALKTICENKEGLDIVAGLIFSWLNIPAPKREYAGNASPETPILTKRLLSNFQCANVAKMEALTSGSTLSSNAITKLLDKAYQHATRPQEVEVFNAPSLALQVLTGNPNLLEKTSCHLVPLLLSWVSEEPVSNEVGESDTEDASADTGQVLSPRKWPQNDRKVFLNLFTYLKRPQTLLRADEVFVALRGLLCNGDADVQRSALKAILTWRMAGLTPYQENLLNLTDDSQIRDEIATFLDFGNYDNCVQIEHRPVLMPIVLRLLYGRMVAKAGNSRGKGDQTSKRKAILSTLSRFHDVYIKDFISITLGVLAEVKLFNDSGLNEARLSQDLTSPRKQLGTLNAMKTMLETLGSKLQSHAPDLFEALFYCFIRASRHLGTSPSQKLIDTEPDSRMSLYKAIRLTSFQCLNLMARHFSPEAFRPYSLTFFSEILSPRLEKLAVETSQAVSSVLHLIAAWAASPSSLSFLINIDARTIPSVSDCLTVPSCKDEVKLFVMDNILLRMLITMRDIESNTESEQLHGSFQKVKDSILQTSSEHLLLTLRLLLQGTSNKEILESGITLVNMLAGVMNNESSQALSIIEVSVSLLRQPSSRVSPKSKGELLGILARFMPIAKSSFSHDFTIQIFSVLSSLFRYFKDRTNRLTLVLAFQNFAAEDEEMEKVSALCKSLNAYSARHVDEPDFDERLKAFNLINETLWSKFSAKQWRPLIENMLFYLKEEEDFAIRSNAAFALRRFIEADASSSQRGMLDLREISQEILLPHIRKGANQPSELVRSEYLGIMAHLIRHNPQSQTVSDLQPLLGGNDEEASFFTNILHIQHHRRLRALRRLAIQATTYPLQSANVSQFLIPLVEHFIFDRLDDESAHNISAEAVKTIGALSCSLEWPQFRAVFRRYCGYLTRETEHSKSVIKLIGVLTDAFSNAVVSVAKTLSNDEKVDSVQLHQVTEPHNSTVLARTLPKEGKLINEISSSLVPTLKQYIHNKDETTVSLRVPVAVSAVKFLKLLPTIELQRLLPPILTDTCNILRSRAQESRDLARKTLSEITSTIGPGYFNFVLKELRTSLARGYQLHVLSFTVHSILVETSGNYHTGDLDHCLHQIVSIVIDDIFGKTGQEKDAEDYISKMKEVKSSKSFDTLELIAKMTTVSQLIHLVRPMQSLLEEKHDLRGLRKIDELLRRIGAGLVRNETIADQRFLMFCYEIIQEANGSNINSDSKYHKQHVASDSSGPPHTEIRASPSKNKLIRFSLDLLRTVLVKHNALQTPENLHGFIPMLGDALMQPDEEIQVSALRLLTAIARVPLRSIDENAGVYVAECVRLIKNTASTNVEISQAAYKLVSIILRDRQPVEIREGDLAYLLKRLVPELEQPDKQGGAFNFVKAVLSRKFVVPEVYEVLDVVASIMVTNQTKSARDTARGAYIQFVLEFPQSKNRFSQQIGFLMRNLSYKHTEGRQSVMEALHLLFTKPGDEVVQKVMGRSFIPLVMILTNDESTQCREMAGVLLRVILERANDQLNDSLLAMLRSWLNQGDDGLLQRAAFQTFGLLLDAGSTTAKREVQFLMPKMSYTLEAALEDRISADWELVYYLLQDFSKICQQSPSSAFAASSSSLWTCIRECLFFPHVWVKVLALKLIGTFYADIARSNAGSEISTLPLKGSGGLLLKRDEVFEVTRASLAVLKAADSSEDAADQSVRNLVFLSKTMMQTSLLWQRQPVEVGNPQNDGDESSSGSDSDSNSDPHKPRQKPAIEHLISQAAGILRSPPATTRAHSLIPMKFSLRLLAVLANTIETSVLRLNVPTILVPLNNLTDSSIPAPFSTDVAFNEGYTSIVSSARDLMSKMQEKLGMAEYLKLLHGVRKIAGERREGRRTKRAIARVANPEVAGRHKIRKGEKRREKRRERHSDHRAMRRGW